MSVVEVHPYSPQWRADFEVLSERIWPAVQAHALRVEHVGSTSVEGLWAKPIIDMDIVIASQKSLREVVCGLGELGYYHRGDLGISGRDVMGFDHPDIRHNLYICIDGCLAYRNHVLLRDHLRQSPSDRDKYSEVKRALAKQYPEDIDSYIDGKTEFILSVLKQYELSGSELDNIASVNFKPTSIK